MGAAGSGRCRVCKHPQIREITLDILNGVGCREIESKYGCSKSAVNRHIQHVPKSLRNLGELERQGAADALVMSAPVLEQIQRLTIRVLRILERAEQKQDHELALEAIREYRKNLEFAARLTGELDPRAGDPAGGPLTVIVQYVDKALMAVPAPTALPEAVEANGGLIPAIPEGS